MSAVISPFGAGLQRVASTGPNGFALQNATPNILTWTAPSDGNLHRAFLWAFKNVTVQEVGGGWGYEWTTPSGNVFNFYALDNGGQAPGLGTPYAQPWNVVVESGGIVMVKQTSALTGGASTVWSEIWAA